MLSVFKKSTVQKLTWKNSNGCSRKET
jgi:hypothetical protein